MDITFLAPCKDLSGGIKVISVYANELLKRGHHVNVVYPRKQFKIRENIRNIRKNGLKKQLDHLDDFQGQLMAVPEMTNSTIPNSDVIIATAWETAEWAHQLSNEKGEKVYFIQGYETWNGNHERVHNTLKYDWTKITISKWLKSKISEISGDNDVHVIPNASNFTAEENPLDFQTKTWDIGMTYSDIPNKGGEIGIEVLGKLAVKYPDLKFVIFGTEIPEHDLPANTEVFLKPRQSKIKEIYSSTRIWLSTSYEEGFCLPCLEAMSCGAAVVSTDNKGVRDIVEHNHNGFLVSTGDAQSMLTKVSKLLDDQQLYLKIAGNGYHRSKEFSWQKSADQFNAILENVSNKEIS